MPDVTKMLSPLAAVDTSGIEKAGISATESSFRGHYNVRGSVEDQKFTGAVQSVLGIDLPLEPNTTTSDNLVTLFWLSPDEWLLVTPDENDTTQVDALRSAINGLFAKLTDISGGQTIIRITGEKTLDLLARGCTFDLHPRVFMQGQCAQSTIAKSPALIHKVPGDDAHVVDVIVRRSFADYLWRWLEDAAQLL